MLAVGTRFSYFPTRAWTLRLPRRLVQVDLDPAEIGRNYPVELGLVGDARAALAGLLAELDRAGGRGLPSRRGEVEAVRRTVLERVGRHDELDVLDQMRRVLPRSALVFNDPTTIAFWARFYWSAYEPRTWFVPAGFGTLGYALPAAIGAKLARPDAEVWAVVGDGGFQMTMAELATIVQERIDINVAIINNGYLGMVRQWQEFFYQRRYAATPLLNPDFVKLADAYGLRALSVGRRSEVVPAVETARAHRGTVVIDFAVEQEDTVYPMVPAGADLRDMIRRPSPIAETGADA
jgi:acetolactate synthase-1/2/3 large subunit